MRVVVLTGAGISAESGLPTFRDADGLWQGHQVDDVATPEAFHRDPSVVHRFYDEPPAALARSCPTRPTSRWPRLEQLLGDELLVVTQNVDDLHERAGSRGVVHMHGELLLGPLCRVRRRVRLGRRPRRRRPARAAASRRCGPTWCGSARSPTTST